MAYQFNNSVKYINELSIVIPCYNEANRIIDTLDDIVQYCKLHIFKWEIIVVDDGSTDETVNIVKNYNNNNIRIIKLSSNIGKGGAVKTGISVSNYEWVLFTDADNATPIKMLARMHRYTKDYKIIIGSRNMRESIRVVKQPFLRSLAGKIFALLVNEITKLNIKDTQCGFKLMKTNLAKVIIQESNIDRFAFDVELLKIYKKYNFKIKEVPVEWYDNTESKLNFKKDAINMFVTLWKLRK